MLAPQRDALMSTDYRVSPPPCTLVHSTRPGERQPRGASAIKGSLDVLVIGDGLGDGLAAYEQTNHDSHVWEPEEYHAEQCQRGVEGCKGVHGKGLLQPSCQQARRLMWDASVTLEPLMSVTS